MPNWAHCTLIVEGDAADLAAFSDLPSDATQPLSFATHVPEPSAEVYAAIEEKMKESCDLCGGTGVRPTTLVEAQATGARWDETFAKMEWMATERAKRLAGAVATPCNACLGEGRRSSHPGWYEWRLTHWGTKWDASFDGPFMALAAEGASVEGSVGQNGVVRLPGSLQYRFDTAWSPPTAWLEAVSRVFPRLRFELRYGEPGAGYAGIAVAHDGELEDREVPVEDVLSEAEMWF